MYEGLPGGGDAHGYNYESGELWYLAFASSIRRRQQIRVKTGNKRYLFVYNRVLVLALICVRVLCVVCVIATTGLGWAGFVPGCHWFGVADASMCIPVPN